MAQHASLPGAPHGRPYERRRPEGTVLYRTIDELCGAAAAGHGVAGEGAGEPLLRVVDPAHARKSERVGESGGFNVHAEVAVPPRDRARLERLCRYLCRPPIAQERLDEMANGKLRYSLKKPWRDGTVALVLEPLDLLARVCALIPPPRFHMVRYHGLRGAVIAHSYGSTIANRAVELQPR